MICLCDIVSLISFCILSSFAHEKSISLLITCLSLTKHQRAHKLKGINAYLFHPKYLVKNLTSLLYREMKTSHKVIIGDSRKMKEIEDESIHLVITAPPYWQLKGYGKKGQIGFNDTYEDYINNLNLVWNECRRVLHDGFRLCINIGDQFARSVYYGRYKSYEIRYE